MNFKRQETFDNENSVSERVNSLDEEALWGVPFNH